MKITRPPKEIDLPTILFSQPGYRPAYGTTSELEAIREGYRPHELTARLQRSGLFLMRALMLSAEHTDDADAIMFARAHAAMLMLGSGWHSFAEVRPGQSEFPFREVRRRRLELPDYTRVPYDERPVTDELHAKGTERVVDCIMRANESITAVRSRDPDQIAAVNTVTGRALGASAIQIISASVGDSWASWPSMGSLDTQIDLMVSGQGLIADAVSLSNQLGNVPSLAMAADPRGNALQTYLWDTMPRPLTDDYVSMQRSLVPV